MPSLKLQSCVAGSWITPGGAPFHSVDPRTGGIVATYTGCGPAEVDAALAGAEEAYRAYRLLGRDRVADFLRAIAGEIEALGDFLLETADRETALGIPRLTGERARTCGQLRAFADLVAEGQWVQASIDTAQPDRQPAPRPDLRRMLRPIGPVAVFGASNFPFAFGAAGGDTASALAAGNPVIVKGHSFHPATNELFAQAVQTAVAACGMPPGVFSLLLGGSHDLGAALVTHPLTRAVGFTGSLKGGRVLMDLAAAREVPIPVYTEMGSVNPVFVCDSALKERLDAVAAGLAGSACLGTGQFCTSPGLVVAVKNGTFEKALRGHFDEKPRGVLLHRRIGAAFSEALGAMAAHPEVEWLNPPANGGADDVMSPPNAVFRTTASAFLSDKGLAEEMFGPSTLLVACDDAAQMEAVAAGMAGNLTATVHASADDPQAAALLALLEQKAGRVIFNGFPTGVEVVPSQQHGGPYPAASVASSTSVGADAITRFARFVAWQAVPDALLPEALRNANPWGIYRKVDGKLTRDPVARN